MFSETDKIKNDSLRPHMLGQFRLFFSTKSDGNMSVSHGARAEVINRRVDFLKSRGILIKKVVFLEPCHTGNIALVQEKNSNLTYDHFTKKPNIDCDFPGYHTSVDGLITLEPSLHIALLTGDCIPLAITDDKSGLHGLLHVGLLGLLNGIIPSLQELLEKLNIPPERVRFHLGPGISADQYDLNRSGLWAVVANQATERCPWIKSFLREQGNQLLMDLHGALCFQLSQIGAARDCVTLSNHYTAAPDSIFFSNYLAKQSGIPNGRFLTVVGL